LISVLYTTKHVYFTITYRVLSYLFYDVFKRFCHKQSTQND